MHTFASLFTRSRCKAAYFGAPILAHSFHFLLMSSFRIPELAISTIAVGSFSLLQVLRASIPPGTSQSNEPSSALAKVKSAIGSRDPALGLQPASISPYCDLLSLLTFLLRPGTFLNALLFDAEEDDDPLSLLHLSNFRSATSLCPSLADRVSSLCIVCACTQFP